MKTQAGRNADKTSRFFVETMQYTITLSIDYSRGKVADEKMDMHAELVKTRIGTAIFHAYLLFGLAFVYLEGFSSVLLGSDVIWSKKRKKCVSVLKSDWIVIVWYALCLTKIDRTV